MKCEYAMVVVTGGWTKNVVTYPIPSLNNDMVIPTSMTAKAVLICRPNSHPFQERTLTLEQSEKVGRSVARAKAAPNNAIFDCKVLSRHHALLWYDCGKFYLQDTKSSNGTFVNNNRLSSNESEPHEVSSGDIVQFGVDVVENNRKVTHGCIIATLKLYLPDGKEAKASPSISEVNGLGMVPLDEIYKLNQIIQEATRREQCLENKLYTLQQYTDEVKALANETWQVRVDEERLLSRVATLEKQLIQAGKNWGEDRIREEFTKLQEEKVAYQEAAKNALQKLHSEKLEAVVDATEKDRARETAEQEVELARKLLGQAQSDLEEVTQKLVDEQKRSSKEIAQLQQREMELKAQLDEKTKKLDELTEKLEQVRGFQLNSMCSIMLREDIEKSNLIYEDDDDLKLKKEMMDDCELDMNKANGEHKDEEISHVKLTVVPVTQSSETSITAEEVASEEFISSGNKVKKQVTLKIPEEEELSESHNGSDAEEASDEKCDSEEKSSDVDHIDSKTLKYQYQSVYNELKKHVEQLENSLTASKSKINELEKELHETKLLSDERSKLSDMYKYELQMLNQKWKESCNECQQLRDRVNSLSGETKNIQDCSIQTERELVDMQNTAISECHLSFEQATALEEELVLIKEKYAQISDEKMVMNKKFNHLREQYNALCNRSYNTMFFYIAPLVLMVLYLLISSITS